MLVAYDLKGIQEAKSIGLGFFDGIHLAHREIIKKTVSLARENGVKSAIITFEKSPYEVFGGDASYITTNEQKAALIEALGVNYLYLLDLSKIKDLSGEQYIEEILYKNFKPKFLVTGFNHHFGAKRSGNPKLLANLAPKFGYKYIEVPEQDLEGKLISSSIIKEFIEQGDLASTRAFLGRNFEIEGEVQIGNKLGRTINFPTANLIWPQKIVKLPYGVYSGTTTVSGKIYQSLISWGPRPTVDDKCILETHIIGFNEGGHVYDGAGDIYGQKITVSFEKKLRDIIKFNSMDELKAAIERDCEAARTS